MVLVDGMCQNESWDLWSGDVVPQWDKIKKVKRIWVTLNGRGGVFGGCGWWASAGVSYESRWREP